MFSVLHFERVVIIEIHTLSATTVFGRVPQGSVLGSSLSMLLADDFEYIASEWITFKLLENKLKLHSSLDDSFRHFHLKQSVNNVVA